MHNQSVIGATHPKHIGLLAQLLLAVLLIVALAVVVQAASAPTLPAATSATENSNHVVVTYFDAQIARWITVYGAMTPSSPVIEDYAVIPSSAPSSARPQNDVLSVDWLEQQRQSKPDEWRAGSRDAQPLPDNTIGFTE